MLIFRQLFDPTSSTYTYLLADPDSREAVLIDPVFEQARRDMALLTELELKLVATCETHVHADHVTAGWLLREQLGSSICVAATAGAEGADRALAPDDVVRFGTRHLQVRATPGHTGGCLTYVLDDETRAFTGDALLIRGCGRTDFQQGNAVELYRSVHMQIFTLPADCLLFPAHDYRGLTVTSVAEERRFNPRLGGEIGERDFVGYMNNLNLPHPRQLDIAVPANLTCGRFEGEMEDLHAHDWAPLTYTFAGIWEIAPRALEEYHERVQILDVRQPDEYDGPLGHIRGARLLPLDELEAAAESLADKQPIVTVCRSGARSAQAVVLLQRGGLQRCANLTGGMLRWRSEGLPVVGGRD